MTVSGLLTSPSLRRTTAAALALGISLAAPAIAGATDKPAGAAGPSVFVGKASVANPITGIPAAPQNPYMGPNQNSTGHNDSWQSDTYQRSGPVGRNPVMRSND